MGLPEYPTGVSYDFTPKAWVREVRDRRYKNKYKVSKYEVQFKGKCVQHFKRKTEAAEFADGINNLIKEA